MVNDLYQTPLQMNLSAALAIFDVHRFRLLAVYAILVN